MFGSGRVGTVRSGLVEIATVSGSFLRFSLPVLAIAFRRATQTDVNTAGVCGVCTACTSVHYTPGVHVLQCAAQLNKVLPYSLFRDQPPLFLEMLRKGRQMKDIKSQYTCNGESRMTHDRYGGVFFFFVSL